MDSQGNFRSISPNQKNWGMPKNTISWPVAASRRDAHRANAGGPTLTAPHENTADARPFFSDPKKLGYLKDGYFEIFMEFYIP